MTNFDMNYNCEEMLAEWEKRLEKGESVYLQHSKHQEAFKKLLSKVEKKLPHYDITISKAENPNRWIPYKKKVNLYAKNY